MRLLQSGYPPRGACDLFFLRLLEVRPTRSSLPRPAESRDWQSDKIWNTEYFNPFFIYLDANNLGCSQIHGIHWRHMDRSC